LSAWSNINRIATPFGFRDSYRWIAILVCRRDGHQPDIRLGNGRAACEDRGVDYDETYHRLIELLDRNGARYRLIDHPAEGRTEVVSGYRGNDLAAAAKCMIVMVKVGKKVTKYVLAVVPGDARVDLQAIKRLYDGTYVSFATPQIAERLSGCVAGTILPLSFDPDLQLIADPRIREVPELFFNAARLDRSMALRTEDFLAVAAPRFESIAAVESGPATFTAADRGAS
jgi:Ala-tRNA(Pro) deacylase